MFHLLTGQDPQDNPLLIFDFNKNPRPRQINPTISEEMEELICRAVEHKPENRFESAREFGNQLKAHLRFLQEGHRPQVPVSPPPPQVRPTVATEVVPCTHCGQDLAPDDLFCAYCGTKQGTKQALARLIVLGTSELSAQFSLNQTGESLIGRVDPNRGIRPEVDLSKYDPAARVSRRHARIVVQDNQYFIEDLGSANGTFLNGSNKLTQGKPQLLTAGDELKLGETTLKFVMA